MIIVNLLHFDQIEPHLAFLLVAILNRSFEAESISFFRIGHYHDDHHHHLHLHLLQCDHLVKKNAVLMFSPPLPGTKGPVWIKDSIAFVIDLMSNVHVG